jgi:uncharacterized protein
MTWFQTYSGKRFNPTNPNSDDIDIADIAHALSMQCRFNGHTVDFYSVAEHSVRVANYLHSIGCEKDVCMQGLLHDASEAYLGDVITPVKEELAEYRVIESYLQTLIYIKFEVPGEESDLVKEADKVLLMTERRDLLPDILEDWPNLAEPLTEEIIYTWSPKVAKERFLDSFIRFRGGL